jgi:hypothetical protein
MIMTVWQCNKDMRFLCDTFEPWCLGGKNKTATKRLNQ